MRALVYILLLTLLMSCKSIEYVPVESIRIEYRTRDSIRVDSIYQHDSVYVAIRGDTVYQYKYKYLYKYQYINKTDTVIKTDSIQVPYPIEKKLSRYQKLKIELGGWVFGIAIVSIILLLIKILKK